MENYANEDENGDEDDDLPPPNRNHELNIEDLGLEDEDDDGEVIDEDEHETKPEKPIKEK